MSMPRIFLGHAEPRILGSAIDALKLNKAFVRVFPSEKVYASAEKLDRFFLRVPLSHLLEGP